MFAKFALASISLLIALPIGHRHEPAPPVPVKVGDLLTVKLNDQVGFLYRSECGITPQPTFPIGRKQNSVAGVRTYRKFVTETSGTVVSVADDGFTVRCLTTVENHADGPRMITVTSTLNLDSIDTTTVSNPNPLFGGIQQSRPQVVRSVVLSSIESAKIQVWELAKTLPEK